MASVSTDVDHDSFDVAADVVEATIDAERTASVDLTATWNGEQSRRITFGNRIPFSYPNFSEGRSGLVLMPPQNEVPRQERGGWVPAASNGGLTFGLLLLSETLEPGDAVGMRWSVWADPEHADYIRRGTYEFTNNVSLATEGPADSTKGEDLGWTFGLEIVDGA